MSIKLHTNQTFSDNFKICKILLCRQCTNRKKNEKNKKADFTKRKILSKTS